MNQLSIQIAKDAVKQLDTVNLTNCDREPIHIPNCIQPQGLLLVLDEPDLQIVQASENAPEILGILTSELLNRPLAEWGKLLHAQADGRFRNAADCASSFSKLVPIHDFT